MKISYFNKVAPTIQCNLIQCEQNMETENTIRKS